MKTFNTCFGGTGLAALAALVLAPDPSHAATILTPAVGSPPIFHVGSFAGTKMFLSKAKDISSGFGTVQTPDDIRITTVGKSIFANGYAQITPAGGGLLTSGGGCGEKDGGAGCGKLTQVTFAPITGNFVGFSFRGKLIDCSQDVYVTVQDAQGDPSQTFDFKVTRSNAEFSRLSILTTLRDKTIKWVEIQTGGGFRQVDQVNWLLQGSQTPEPATWSLMVIGLGGLGGVLRRKRRLAAA